MSKAPAFQFYTGNRLQELMPIIADNEAVGAWVKAMIFLWNNGPSPADRLAQVAGKGWDRVGFLFTDRDGLLSLEWMEAYRAELAEYRARQSANGKKGGRPKSKHGKGENPSLSSGLTQTKANGSPRVEDEDEDEGVDRKGVMGEPIGPSFSAWWKLLMKCAREWGEIPVPAGRCL